MQSKTNNSVNRSRAFSLVFLLPLVVALGCGAAAKQVPPAVPVPVPVPAAVTVTVTPLSADLAPGAQQKIVAQVLGSAEQVGWSIDEGAAAGTVSAAGIFTASNVEGDCHVRAIAAGVSAAATVRVRKGLPVVTAFVASPASIVAGSKSQLSWEVSGATALSINDGIGTVTGTGVQVAPAVTTSYVLTASNSRGSTTAKATVTVTAVTPPPPAPPAIASFVPSPASISPGQSSKLSWSVSGATSLSIDQGVGAVTGSSALVSPAATTTYTLTATNSSGSATAQATVSVASSTGSGLPVIANFAATPSPAKSGQAVTLSWSASNAASLSISGGVGAVGGTSVVVHPLASTTWFLIAVNPNGEASAAVTATVLPGVSAPVIDSFAADAPFVEQGAGGTVLRWSVANASALQIEPGVGAVSGSSVVVNPSSDTTYTLTATSATSGVAAATSVLQVRLLPGAASFAAPGPAAGQVTFTLDSAQLAHPISRFIYGYNATDPAAAPAGTAWLRLGGNRYTAYDWETGASNAGSDYGPYSNDSYLTSSSTPGEVNRPTVAKDRAQGLGTLVTLPMQGWVAADESGPVPVAGALTDHFFQSMARKGSAFASTPNTTDRYVFQDEYVSFLGTQFPGAFADPQAPVQFSLDNEPDLWSGTHAEIERAPVTYAELLRKTVDLAAAVKDAAPAAVVFGPVSYGFNGYVNLQNATDAGGQTCAASQAATPLGCWFLDSFLQRMAATGDGLGHRLIDVLDLHWYSEATDSSGTRVIDPGNTASVQAARVQAPRSLWDKSYVEQSWITQYLGGVTGECGSTTACPIALLPTLAAKVAAGAPGTKLAFTEYDYGGADDISGAVAEADVLGIFGRDSVYASSFWPLLSDNRFVFGAFRAFRDYDGKLSAFGDTSFSASSSNDAQASVYASMDAGHPERVVLVAVNKTPGALTAALRLTHSQALGTAHVYRLVSSSPYDGSASVVPQQLADLSVASNALVTSLPGYSVTTFVLVP